MEPATILGARNGAADSLDCGTDFDVALVDDGSNEWNKVYDSTTGCEAWNPQNLMKKVEAGGTVTNEAWATDPVALVREVPTGGEVTIAKTDLWDPTTRSRLSEPPVELTRARRDEGRSASCSRSSSTRP